MSGSCALQSFAYYKKPFNFKFHCKFYDVGQLSNEKLVARKLMTSHCVNKSIIRTRAHHVVESESHQNISQNERFDSNNNKGSKSYSLFFIVKKISEIAMPTRGRCSGTVLLNFFKLEDR